MYRPNQAPHLTMSSAERDAVCSAPLRIDVASVFGSNRRDKTSSSKRKRYEGNKRRGEVYGAWLQKGRDEQEMGYDRHLGWIRRGQTQTSGKQYILYGGKDVGRDVALKHTLLLLATTTRGWWAQNPQYGITQHDRSKERRSAHCAFRRVFHSQDAPMGA